MSSACTFPVFLSVSAVNGGMVEQSEGNRQAPIPGLLFSLYCCPYGHTRTSSSTYTRPRISLIRLSLSLPGCGVTYCLSSSVEEACLSSSAFQTAGRVSLLLLKLSASLYVKAGLSPPSGRLLLLLVREGPDFAYPPDASENFRPCSQMRKPYIP